MALQRAQGSQVSWGDVPWRQHLLGRLAQLTRNLPESLGQRFVADRVARSHAAILGHGNSVPVLLLQPHNEVTSVFWCLDTLASGAVHPNGPERPPTERRTFW